MSDCNFMTHSRSKLLTPVQDWMHVHFGLEMQYFSVSWKATAPLKPALQVDARWSLVWHGRLTLRIRCSAIQRLHLCNTFSDLWPTSFLIKHKERENMMNDLYGMSSYKQARISLIFPWHILRISLLFFGFVCFLFYITICHKDLCRACSCAHHITLR